jgi:hypothetical protein
MSTPKESTIEVYFYLPVAAPHKREAEVAEEIAGYRYIRYANERETVERDVGESLGELLSLVPPSHPKKAPPDLDPVLVAKFLSRWGISGTRLLSHPLWAGVGVPERARELAASLARDTFSDKEWNELSAKFEMANAREILELKGKDWLEKHLVLISMGRETPFNWIQEELIEVAQAARLIKSLELTEGLTKSELKLTTATLKKIEKEFDMSAETALKRFARTLNNYLSPLTDPVITITFKNLEKKETPEEKEETKKKEEAEKKEVGYAAAFSSWLLDLLRNGGAFLVCQECGRSYVPKHILKINGNKFCPDGCGARKRKRDYARRTRAAQRLSNQINPKSSSETKKGKVANGQANKKTN